MRGATIPTVLRDPNTRAHRPHLLSEYQKPGNSSRPTKFSYSFPARRSGPLEISALSFIAICKLSEFPECPSKGDRYNKSPTGYNKALE